MTVYRLRPLTQRECRAWIAAVHRHLPPPRGDVIRVGLTADGQLIGAACAGRPVARMLDDGLTLEITRVATLPGHDCAPSRLYGALRRAAQALGYVRLVTYTLPGEPGTSLRAAGWRDDGETDGGEWSRDDRQRPLACCAAPKRRWVWP